MGERAPDDLLDDSIVKVDAGAEQTSPSFLAGLRVGWQGHGDDRSGQPGKIPGSLDGDVCSDNRIASQMEDAIAYLLGVWFGGELAWSVTAVANCTERFCPGERIDSPSCFFLSF